MIFLINLVCCDLHSALFSASFFLFFFFPLLIGVQFASQHWFFFFYTTVISISKFYCPPVTSWKEPFGFLARPSVVCWRCSCSLDSVWQNYCQQVFFILSLAELRTVAEKLELQGVVIIVILPGAQAWDGLHTLFWIFTLLIPLALNPANICLECH